MATSSYPINRIDPNPFMDLKTFPLDPKKVRALRRSIRGVGFWGGLVARPIGDRAQLAYGHHRLAALQEEFSQEHEVELVVRDLDNQTMIRMMAQSNMDGPHPDARVQVLTVMSVLEAVHSGVISLPTAARSPVGELHRTSSFLSQPSAGGVVFSEAALGEFMGWLFPDGRPRECVRSALWSLELIRIGCMEWNFLDGLSLREAEELARATMTALHNAARAERQDEIRAARCEAAMADAARMAAAQRGDPAAEAEALRARHDALQKEEAARSALARVPRGLPLRRRE